MSKRRFSPALLRLLLIVLAATASSATIGCKRRSTEAASGGLPRAETFYVAGRQWGEPTSFNPISSSPSWPVNGLNLMYETLLLYNPQSGKMEPLLAESFEVRDSRIELTLNAAARWTDGAPVTAADVKFSYELGRKFPSLPMAPVWQYLSEVVVLGARGSNDMAGESSTPEYPRGVAFVLNAAKLNPLVVLDALQDVRIVPQHVVEPLLLAAPNIEAFTQLKFDQDPIISGPYQLKVYSSEKIVLERRPEYWGIRALYAGKLPGPRYVVHPIYKSNDHFSVALQQGRLDMSSTFVPRIWLKAKKGVGSWFDGPPYFQGASLPMLFINVKRGALADVAYRRAMAFAINYTDIRELAVSGYSEPLRPGLILPFGPEAKYFSSEDAEKYGTRHDPDEARALLKHAGYQSVLDEQGELLETRDKNGQRVPTLFVKSPTGWSDWESIVRIVVRCLREVGIDARERFVDASLFRSAVFQGDFDLIMNTPTSVPTPSKPWSRFEAVMTTQDFAPEGEKMYKNMGRFNDPSSPGYLPRIDELLATIPKLKDEAQLALAYRELNAVFMQQQPTLPLVYRPDQYYQFSTRHWRNYATAKNPYLPPQIPGERLGTRMLWSIEPVVQN